MNVFDDYMKIFEKADLYYQACVNMMDDDLREDLHSELAPCTEDEFLETYCDRHLAKFNEIFYV